MKIFVLNFLKQANEHKKAETDSSFNESRHTTIIDTNVSNSLQHEMVKNLPFEGQIKVSETVEKHKKLEQTIQGNIDNIDMSVPSTEIKEVQGHHTILAIRANLNNKINEIFASYNMPISPDMTQATSVQNSSLAENKILSNKLIDHVKADLAIDKELDKKPLLSLDKICESKGISKEDYVKPKGNIEECVKSLSNVKDFADPNLEMPSYMDPED